ncbi:hypothetical protein [uncultured Neglectibacter sp.]|uniref:hypothetical protein n=1 Tax=uncultured Neglectibacter sp. TaxID=1924108 RepID=UPI0034DF9F4E
MPITLSSDPQTKTCRDCGREIPASVENCPYCRKANRKPFYQQIWFWGVALGCVVGILLVVADIIFFQPDYRPKTNMAVSSPEAAPVHSTAGSAESDPAASESEPSSSAGWTKRYYTDESGADTTDWYIVNSKVFEGEGLFPIYLNSSAGNPLASVPVTISALLQVDRDSLSFLVTVPGLGLVDSIGDEDELWQVTIEKSNGQEYSATGTLYSNTKRISLEGEGFALVLSEFQKGNPISFCLEKSFPLKRSFTFSVDSQGFADAMGTQELQELLSSLQVQNGDEPFSAEESDFEGSCGVEAVPYLDNGISGEQYIQWISVTNISGKDIDSLQFAAIYYDGSGDIIDSLTDVISTDAKIGAGEQRDIVCDSVGTDAVSAKFYLYSVHFTDGTTWGSRNADMDMALRWGALFEAEVHGDAWRLMEEAKKKN